MHYFRILRLSACVLFLIDTILFLLGPVYWTSGDENGGHMEIDLTETPVVIIQSHEDYGSGEKYGKKLNEKYNFRVSTTKITMLVNPLSNNLIINWSNKTCLIILDHVKYLYL